MGIRRYRKEITDERVIALARTYRFSRMRAALHVSTEWLRAKLKQLGIEKETR